MPSISVVIPAYNSQDCIEDAIRSVIVQTYPVKEIIVVDDGSDDATADRIKKHMNDLSGLVRYVYQTNKGPASARNLGIISAIGEYIAFLDSDDQWLPDKIKKQMAVMKIENTIGLVCTGRFRVDENDRTRFADCRGSTLTADSYLDLWEKGSYVVTSSVIVRKECFDVCGLFDETKNAIGAEDGDMWLRIAEKYKILYLNEPLVNYMVSRRGLCRSDTERAYESVAYVITKNQQYLKKNYKNHRAILRKKWFNYYFDYAITLFDMGHIAQAHEKFKNTFSYSSFNCRAILYFIITHSHSSVFRKIRNIKKFFIGRIV